MSTFTSNSLEEVSSTQLKLDHMYIVIKIMFSRLCVLALCTFARQNLSSAHVPGIDCAYWGVH